MSGSEGSEKVASSVSEDSSAFSSSAFSSSAFSSSAFSSSAFSSGSSGGFFSSMVESSDSGVSSFDSGVSSEVGSEGDDSSASSGCDLPLELLATRFNPFLEEEMVLVSGVQEFYEPVNLGAPIDLEWNLTEMAWELNYNGISFFGGSDKCEPRGIYISPGEPNWVVDDV